MELIIIIYTIWAVYSGYKVLSGRNEWLDRRAPASIAAKCALTIHCNINASMSKNFTKTFYVKP